MAGYNVEKKEEKGDGKPATSESDPVCKKYSVNA